MIKPNNIFKLLLFGAVFWTLAAPDTMANPPTTPDRLARKALVAKVNGVISPVSAKFISNAIDEAEVKNAVCLIIELDTPGGLDDSMRTIIKRILTSRFRLLFMLPRPVRGRHRPARLSPWPRTLPPWPRAPPSARPTRFR